MKTMLTKQDIFKKLTDNPDGFVAMCVAHSTAQPVEDNVVGYDPTADTCYQVIGENDAYKYCYIKE